MSPAVRFYLINERLILGGVMLIVVLLAWEGLERGWWASLLEPMAGASAERLRLKPIFISSPTLVLQAAYRMFFVTGEMWRDLAWSALGYSLGLACAIAAGIPLGLAAGWYRRLSYAVEPFLAALNATPQVAFLPLIVIWVGTGMGARVLIIFLLAVLPLAINAHAAVRTTDPRLIAVARSFGASEARLLQHHSAELDPIPACRAAARRGARHDRRGRGRDLRVCRRCRRHDQPVRRTV